MRRDSAVRLAVALIAATMPRAAAAALDSASIMFDGLRLGMTADAVEKVISSRDDVSEIYRPDLQSFACDELLSHTSRGRISASRPPRFPAIYGFDDARGTRYAVETAAVPGGAIVRRISVREPRGFEKWETYLQEAEARFGKPDFNGRDEYGQMSAAWCQGPASDCAPMGTRHATLSMSLAIPDSGSSERTNMLDWYLDEGEDTEQERTDSVTQASKDAARAPSLRKACRNSSGWRLGHDEETLHRALLLPFVAHGERPRLRARKVPHAVFAAMGYDSGQVENLSSCSESPNTDRCSSTMYGFEWAVRLDHLWIVAMWLSGARFGYLYSAVRDDGQGHYHLAWEQESLAGFMAWRRSGEPDVKPAG